MFHVPNKFRDRYHPLLGSQDSVGNSGYFKIPIEDEGVIVQAHVIASDGMGWEHVSVHIEDGKEEVTPLWDEMCKIKDLFWDEEDTVVQFHPPKSEYVNCHKHTLHLWRPTNYVMMTPPSILIGPKKR